VIVLVDVEARVDHAEGLEHFTLEELVQGKARQHLSRWG
jgi:hypothetical protein